jgi:hypothetical protein
MRQRKYFGETEDKRRAEGSESSDSNSEWVAILVAAATAGVIAVVAVATAVVAVATACL